MAASPRPLVRRRRCAGDASSKRNYINFPSAVAQAMEFTKGETVEWIVADKGHLILARKDVPPNPIDIQ